MDAFHSISRLTEMWDNRPRMLVLMTEDDAATKPDADMIHDRVDKVIQDLGGNRVVPRKIDELEQAIDKNRRDKSVFRATKRD
jgi:hypothetical protein